MASQIELAIETLKISLDRQNPAETLRQVEQIVQPFDDHELTGPENGLYLFFLERCNLHNFGLDFRFGCQ